MQGLSSSKQKDLLAASALSISCAKAGVSRSLEDLSQVLNTDRRSINKNQAQLVEDLQITLPLLRPSHIVSTNSCPLRLNESVTEHCRQVCEVVSSLGILEGKSPQSIACGSIVLVCLLEHKPLCYEYMQRLCKFQTLANVYHVLLSHVMNVLPLHLLSLFHHTIPQLPKKLLENEFKDLLAGFVVAEREAVSRQRLSITQQQIQMSTKTKKRPPAALFTAITSPTFKRVKKTESVEASPE